MSEGYESKPSDAPEAVRAEGESEEGLEAGHDVSEVAEMAERSEAAEMAEAASDDADTGTDPDAEDSADETSGTQDRPTLEYVVGIGASAGGFEALEQFFKHMASDSNMAFVVVQHLSPDHKSLMAELLSKHTSMPVTQASENIRLEPNRIYLIPPGKVMTVLDGRLHLAGREGRSVPNYPIDVFLKSLAEDQGEQAIAIILSGTGSDGSRGVREIQDKAGLVMVQDPVTAKFDGMPKNAMSTGMVDFVLAPTQMPLELGKLAEHPFSRDRQRARRLMARQQHNLNRIFAILRNAADVDFTNYKQSTVLRRIERRMNINRLTRIEDYIDLLNQSEREARSLYKELLIGVTSFFRDPEAFEVLKAKVLPEIFQRQKGTVRVWVCGASTGEEAYSVAMVFAEYMAEANIRREVKIFATDVDQDALEFASAGLYPENIAQDMPRDRLAAFFTRAGDRFQIKKSVREMVIFARHNIIKDPPFNKIDLLTCRNMLIYFQSNLQQRVLSYFNFATNENGFLFLGTSETVGDLTSHFSIFDTKWKIYRSRGKHIPIDFEGFSISPVRRPANQTAPTERYAYPQDFSASPEAVTQHLLGRFAPPAVVCTDRFELVHVVGDVSRYVKLKPGPSSLKLTSLIRKELAVAVETGVSRAMRTEEEVVYSGVRLEDGEDAYIDLVLTPIIAPQGQQRLFIVAFLERRREEAPSTEPAPPGAESDQRFADLENELQYTKENLQATIEEVETTNEELQATNEELLSANEELQSTNEELQSVNEELITVNAEYQTKIQELTDLNNDMSNLLASTDIGVVFLDRDLTIRRFTPAVKNEVNIMDFDVGRPIGNVSLSFDYPDIAQDAASVLHKLAPVQREFRTSEDKWLLVRLLPYITVDNAIKGVVLTIIDVSEIKRSQLEVLKLSKAVAASPSVIAITDTGGIIEYVNRSFERITGYTAAEAMGSNARLLKSDRTPPETFREMWETISAGRTWHGVFQNKRKDGAVYAEKASIAPVLDEKNAIVNYVKVAEDISRELAMEQELRGERDLLKAIADASPVAIIMVDAAGHIVFADKQAEELFGLDREEIVSRTYNAASWRISDPNGEPMSEEELPVSRVLRSGKSVFDVRLAIERPDGERIYLSVNSCPMLNEQGEVTGVVSAAQDITRRLDDELRLRFLSSIVESAEEGIIGKDLTGVVKSWNAGAERIYGYTAEEARGRNIAMLVPEDRRDEFADYMARVKAGEAVEHLETERLTKSRERIRVALSLSPIRDGQDRIIGVSTFVRTIEPHRTGPNPS